MKPFSKSNSAANGFTAGIDAAPANVQHALSMKTGGNQIAGFSLVEVTLALGVAAICLLALLALLPVASKTQQTSMQQTTANQIISQISSVLRADVSLPPGQLNRVCGDPPDPNTPCNWSALHGHWLQQGAPPDTMYFTNEGRQTGTVGNGTGTPPADAVFRVKITYNPVPPTGNTSVANVVVNWPAAVDPGNGGVPAGYIITTLSVNR